MCSDRPAVSVVIPAYNAAATVAAAIASVGEVSGGVEVIVVDDCSADATAAVAREAGATVVSHSRNRGAAAAMNTAVDAARGEFIARLDADDAFLPGALDAMLGLARSSGARLVRGGFIRRTGDRNVPAAPSARVTDLNDFPVSVDYFSLWAKLIGRELLTAPGMEPFEGLDCWDDLGVIARVMALRPAVATLDRPVYSYTIAPRGQSLSTSSRERLLHDHLAVARRLEEWFAERGLQDEFAEFLDHLKFAAKVKMLRGRGRDVAGWKSTFPEVNGRIMGLRHVGMHHRLLFSAVALLPAGLAQWVSDAADLLTPKAP